MTPAGKRLLARLSLDVPWFIAGNKDIEEQMVLAIEADAVAAERARIAEAVEGLAVAHAAYYVFVTPDAPPPDGPLVSRAAVLAAIGEDAK